MENSRVLNPNPEHIRLARRLLHDVHERMISAWNANPFHYVGSEEQIALKADAANLSLQIDNLRVTRDVNE